MDKSARIQRAKERFFQLEQRVYALEARVRELEDTAEIGRDVERKADTFLHPANDKVIFK